MVKRIFVSLALIAAALFSTGATAPEKFETVVLTSDNTLVMDQEYTDTSVAKVALAARELDARLPAWQPINLVILSGGGSIEAGLELIDNLNSMGRKINTVTLFSASMAFQNVQGLPGRRLITTSGTLMSHKAKGSFSGEFPGQLDSRYQYYLRRIGKLDEVTAARSAGKYTLASYRAAYENELWCEGQDCVDSGLADAAVLVKCDKSLDGTKVSTEALEFMGMPIEVTLTKAACPTITGVLDLKVKISGEDASVEDIDTLTLKYKLTPKNANELRQLVEKKIEELTPSREIRGY